MLTLSDIEVAELLDLLDAAIELARDARRPVTLADLQSMRARLEETT